MITACLWVGAFFLDLPNMLGWGDHTYDMKTLACSYDRVRYIIKLERAIKKAFSVRNKYCFHRHCDLKPAQTISHDFVLPQCDLQFEL